MTLLSFLLAVHITAGGVALLSGIFSSMVKQYDWPHHWHRRFGQCFFYSMVVILFTAIPMSLMTNNMFLLFIAVFSFYFAHAGWRYAKNKTGRATREDWIAVSVMTFICLGMFVYALVLWGRDDGQQVTLIVFSVLGIISVVRDAYSLYTSSFAGKQRIALHATMMLAGVIATVTAFVVTNFTTHPEYILWIAPSILIVPYIIYWNIRLTVSIK